MKLKSNFFILSQFLIILWSFPSNGWSQISSIEEIVTEILQKNPEIKAGEAELAKAKGEYRSANQWKNPEITAEYAEKRVQDLSGELLGKDSAQRYSIEQTFEFPGKASLRKAIANHQIELAELALEQLRLEVAAKTRLLVIQWLAADREVNAASIVEERHKALVEVLKKRALGGVQSQVELKIIEADRVRILAQSHEIEEKKLATQIALNVLRGKPYNSPIQLEASLELIPIDLAYETLLEKAIQNNFALKSRKIETTKSHTELDQARIGSAPDITVGPFFSTEKAVDQEHIFGVGISMPFPLWNSNRGQVDISQAKITEANAKESQAFRNLQQELSQQYHAYQHILHLLDEISFSSLNELQQAAEFADRQYRLGTIPNQTYLEMQDQYLEATSTLLDTVCEGHEHFLKIQLLTSNPSLLGKSNQLP